MANWTTPAVTSLYVDVLGHLKDRDVDLAKMFDGVTATNIPTGAIKWLSANSKIQKYNGVSWDDQIVSVAGGGTGSATAAGARTNLGLGTISTQNANAISVTGGTIKSLRTESPHADTWILDNTTTSNTYTKGFRFDVTNLSAGVYATLYYPPGNISTTIVGDNTTQTLTNKTLTNCDVTTQTIGNNTTKAASTAFVQSAAPPGVIWAWPGVAAPAGFLLCYGQAISRTSFAALFAAIGTQFGAGDGSTTFNVPDLRGFVIAGLDNMGGTTANRLTSMVASHTMGGTGGQQWYPSGIGVGVSGSISGGTSGSLSVGVSMYSMDNESLSVSGLQFGGGGYAAAAHVHYNTHSSGGTSGSLGVSGSCSASGGTAAFSTTQPTMCFNYIIKY